MKLEMVGWQWHQLDHMQVICTSLQTDNHTSTSSLHLLQAGFASWRPTNGVKALKAYQQNFWLISNRNRKAITRGRSDHCINILPPVTLNPWPMTATFKLDLDDISVSQHAKCWGKRSLVHTCTHTHTGPVSLYEPLTWSVTKHSTVLELSTDIILRSLQFYFRLCKLSCTLFLRMQTLCNRQGSALNAVCIICLSVCLNDCLQCFDTVGWAAGRASGL